MQNKVVPTREQIQAILNIKSDIVKIRGEIIDIFTQMEFVIDEIIRKTAFDNESEFYEYANKNIKGEMSMRDKKEFFKICIEKYSKRNSEDLTGFYEKINTIINIRTQMAHWYTDTSINGADLYISKKKIRLVNVSMNKKEVESFYDLSYIKNFEKIIVSAMGAIINMKNNIDAYT